MPCLTGNGGDGVLAGIATSRVSSSNTTLAMMMATIDGSPLHGYDYADTPLCAGIYMLPLTAG